MNEGKIQVDKEQYLQPQTDTKHFKYQYRQPPLPKAPILLFERNQIKKESGQKIIEERLLENTKENNEIYTNKTIIQYPKIGKETNYYHQIIHQPLIHFYSDIIDLQKDFINTFQPRWVDLLLSNVENHLTFQNKMMLLYLQNSNVYLKTIFNTKIKEQKKDEEKNNIFIKGVKKNENKSRYSYQ
ncbi:MAG: hypothetical protein ACTHME_00985 [Candidatus Nitrosocosmicus sp.]